MTNYEYQDLCEELPMDELREILEEILNEEILNKDKEHIKDQVLNHYVSLISDEDVKDYLREDDRIGEYAERKQEEDYEPTDQEMMSSFGTKWHDGLRVTYKMMNFLKIYLKKQSYLFIGEVCTLFFLRKKLKNVQPKQHVTNLSNYHNEY